MEINEQAKELNDKILNNNPSILDMLSERGKAIFFPKSGILGQSAEAKGKKINATIGSAVEDDGTPMRLNSIAKYIILDSKDVFPYAPSYGKQELRKKWLEMMKKKNPSFKSKTSLPVVTNALTHGLSTIGYMFMDEGDKVIVSDKFWGNYKLTFTNAYGAELDEFKTFNDGGFDVSALKEKLVSDGNKKIILLNFPNNPTGYTPTEEEAKDIIDAIKESAENGKNILVICDDAYFGLVYEEGIYKESLFSQLSEIHENVLAVKVDGATKEDYVWGMRVGFITYGCKGIADETAKALEDKTAGAIRGNISNVSHPSQSLLLKAFSSDTYEQEKKQKYQILKNRYYKVKEALKNQKYEGYFSALPYNSGYFMCVELKELDGEEVRKRLLEKYDTGTIAIKNMIRIAFSSVGAKQIPELFENLYNACKDIKGEEEEYFGGIK